MSHVDVVLLFSMKGKSPQALLGNAVPFRGFSPVPQAVEPDPNPLPGEYGFEQSPRHNDSESHRVALIAEKYKREDGEFLPLLILGSCPFLKMQSWPGC